MLQRKLGAVMKGYKTRRILSKHCTLGVLKKEYYDLLSFTFGLQHEMRQSKQTVSHKTKQLMVQSVRDLNQKRKMLNRVLETVMAEKSAQWLRDSRLTRDSSQDYGTILRQASALNSLQDIDAPPSSRAVPAQPKPKAEAKSPRMRS